MVISCLFGSFDAESFSREAEEAEVREDVGPLPHTVQSGGPGNGKNGPSFTFSLF